ncbi:MAG: hypothetical protein ACREEH_09490, partial [Caulobacteraceae bacterium]
AHFCVVRNGVQTSLHASRWLGLERMDLVVGPIAITVVEPLRQLRVSVEAPAQGLKAEVNFTGRAFPIEEPRFTRRAGTRLVMDYTRLTQNARCAGWVELDGERQSLEGWIGGRDRSWGIRPVGARDAQAIVPPQPPQFFWIWGPANMPGGSFFFHTNDEASGAPWNRRAVWAPDGADPGQFHEFGEAAFSAQWRKGTRRIARATVKLADPHAVREVIYEPLWEFQMIGLGYGHPSWGHGLAHGDLEVEREDYDLAALDPNRPEHLHVQAISKVIDRPAGGGQEAGVGVLEQLVIGPHGPSGFSSTLDLAT